MSEIEIGRNKRGRRSYSFDDVAVVPPAAPVTPEDVSTSWQVDAYRFDIPIFAAPMDSIMSPEVAIELGEHGGLGVLDLEGLWTRYEDPTSQYDRIANASDAEVVTVMREIYEEPVKAELIRDRIQQLRDAGVTAAGSLSPPSAPRSTGRRSSTPASTCSSSAAPRSPRSTSPPTASR